MASGRPGTRATARSATRPPVLAGPMLRHRRVPRRKASTAAEACAWAGCGAPIVFANPTQIAMLSRNRTGRIGTLLFGEPVYGPILAPVAAMRWSSRNRGDMQDMRGRSGVAMGSLGVGGFLVLL